MKTKIEETVSRMQKLLKEKIHLTLEFVNTNDTGATKQPFLIDTGLFAFKENWKDKIGKVTAVLMQSGSNLDVQSVLAPKNEGEQSSYFKIGALFFTGTNISGQLEFLQEVQNGIVVKEFTLTTFYLLPASGKKTCCEISSNWIDGIILCCRSIKEFQKDPEKFAAERI